MTIDEFGRVLTAMAAAVTEKCYGSNPHPAYVLDTALRAGAAKCVEIAKEDLPEMKLIKSEMGD